MSARIHIQSQGCSANLGEGEIIAGLLGENNQIVGKPDDADLLILNVCTAKGNGSALELVRESLKTNPHLPLVVAGCVTADLARDLHRIDPRISVTTTRALTRIPQIVEQTLSGQRIVDFSRDKTLKAGLPRKRLNPAIGIVAVSNGCLDACTFCSTRLVKGRHYSFPAEKIIADIQSLLRDGCREIWLTGQDAGCWGFEWNTNLAHLVKEILRSSTEDFRLRIGMGNPRHLLHYWEELAAVFEDSRVFRFIHLPVQSGSDRVLRAMGRKHSAGDFLMLVEAFRARVPDITISTDLIAGFPGETEEDFRATLDLLSEARPLVCNITRFVVRPGTVAASLPDQIHRDEKKRRSAALARRFAQIAWQENIQKIGSVCSVLVAQPGKESSWIAHNDQYRPVILSGAFVHGQRLRVRITDANSFSLFATPIE